MFDEHGKVVLSFSLTLNGIKNMHYVSLDSNGVKVLSAWLGTLLTPDGNIGWSVNYSGSG